MSLPSIFDNLRLPVISAPLFIVSGVDLVIAQCKAGVVGSFPALNAREADGDSPMLETWLQKITDELDAHNQANPDRPAAPYAVNQIVHRSNDRVERDVEICAKWNVPIWITSMGAREDVNEAAHSCGGWCCMTLSIIVSPKKRSPKALMDWLLWPQGRADMQARCRLLP